MDFFPNWMEDDDANNFLFVLKPNGITFCYKIKRKWLAQSYFFWFKRKPPSLVDFSSKIMMIKYFYVLLNNIQILIQVYNNAYNIINAICIYITLV